MLSSEVLSRLLGMGIIWNTRTHFIYLFIYLFVIVREVKHKSRLFTDIVECPSLDISKI